MLETFTAEDFGNGSTGPVSPAAGPAAVPLTFSADDFEAASTWDKARFAAVKSIAGTVADMGAGLQRLEDIGPIPQSFVMFQRAERLANENNPDENPLLHAYGELGQEWQQRRTQLMQPGTKLETAARADEAAAAAAEGATPGNATAAKGAELVGGMVPYLLSGPAAPLTGGMASYGSTYNQAYTFYRQQGMTDEQATAAADKAAGLAGATSAEVFMALPGVGKSAAERLLAKHLTQATPVVQSAVRTLAAGSQGSLVMGADTFLREAQARQTYNPDLSWGDVLHDTAKAVATGFVATAAMHGAGEVPGLVKQTFSPADFAGDGTERTDRTNGQRPADDWLPGPVSAPVPGTPESVQAQAAAAADPNQARAAVLQTPGETAPSGPASASLQPVATAQGTAWVNPQKISPEAARDALATPNGGGKVLGMASDTRPAQPTAAVTTRDAAGTPVLDEAVTPETLPAAVAQAQANAPAAGSVEVRSPEAVVAERLRPLTPALSPSRERETAPMDREAVQAFANRAVNEMSANGEPIPVSTLQQSGILPEALKEGYALNPAGTHYEFTAPASRMTPAQEMTRANVEAMNALRAAKQVTDAAEQQLRLTNGGINATEAGNITGDVVAEYPGIPSWADVPANVGEVRAGGGEPAGHRSGGEHAAEEPAAGMMPGERPPDILDDISDNFPSGVQVTSAADHGEYVREYRDLLRGLTKKRQEPVRTRNGREFLSLKTGERGDVVLQGLHDLGLYRRLRSEDELYAAMNRAAEARAQIKYSLDNSGKAGEVPGGETAPTQADLAARARWPAIREGLVRQFPGATEVLGTARPVAVHLGDVRIAEALGISAEARAALERTFGVRLQWLLADRKLPFNGFRDPATPGILWIDARNRQLGLTVAGHELMHELRARAPSTFAVMDRLLSEWIKDEPAWRQYLADVYRDSPPKDALEEREELYAHFLGDQMGRPEFWNRLAAKDPNVFQRLAAAAKSFLDRIVSQFRSFSSERWFTDVAQARDIVIAALRDFQRRTAATSGEERQYSIEPETGERQFAEQLRDAEDISSALKGEVTNTTYERRPQEEDAAYAQRIIGDVGVDRAVQVFRQETRLPQPVRMALGMQVLKTLDAAGRVQDAAHFFDNDLAPATTDAGQGLAMLGAWHVMSKEGKLFWAQNKLARAREDAIAPVRPDIEAAKGALQRLNVGGIEHATADPQVQGVAREAIEHGAAGSMETHNAVVMELTQPWASSKVILDLARNAVHAKANELLNRAPRPPQLSPAQHLRAILEGLAQRAATIAAGHYQGAEPGVPLNAKLQERLGLAPAKAEQLAKALDAEFKGQVEKARKALPARIARQIVRQQQGLHAEATDTVVDRAIRRQLAEAKVKLGALVREHWTRVDATGTALQDKLVRIAGLSGADAQKLAETIQRRFEALTAAGKKAELEKLLKPVQRTVGAKPGLVDRLVKLSNLGAFDDPKFYNAVRERLNLPEWTPALRDQLNAIADRISRIPADRIEDAQRAQTEFLNTLERAKGISNMELGMAFYMQNILSGLTTHLRVAIHTSAQMAAATTAEVSRALLGGRLEDVPLIFEALARGGRAALTQQKDVLRSGIVTGSKIDKPLPLSVLENVKFGHAGGTTFKQGAVARMLLENRAARLLNLWKYNSRLITAQHLLYYLPAEQMKVALLAARQARTEGLKGRAAVDRARQILGYGASQVRAAEAQALREGYEGTRSKMRVAEILRNNLPPEMRQTTHDYALRQTFLSDPYGFAGAIAEVVQKAKQSQNATLATTARVIVPFTRIAANLFNEGLNYTPVGAARARWAKTELVGNKLADISLDVRQDMQRELYAKAALGTMFLTAIAFKAAQGLSQPNPSFTVYGTGPNNPQDKQAWRAAGGVPYSVKVGSRFYSYANTPASVMLAALGNYLDSVRDASLYQRPGAKRLAEDVPLHMAAATVGMGKVILEQPFLQSLVDVFKMAGEPNPEVAGKGAAKTVARAASSFVVPNLVRQVDRFYDPTAYSQADLGGILTSQVPFVRQEGRPMLNALGQPVQSPVFGLFTGKRPEDPLVQTLTDHNAWPSLPDRNQTAVNGVPLSDDEFYSYCKTRGEALAGMLRKADTKAILDNLQEQTDRLNAQADAATNPVAKAALATMATRLKSTVMGKYTTAADKQAEAAVVRQRGY